VEGLSPCTLVRNEALALRSRLRRIRPFSLAETMVPAAAPSVPAMRAIERHIADSIAGLMPEVDAFLDWIGQCPPAEVVQTRFSLLRLRFNLFLDRFDIFADAITQRSEQPIGVWLAGLDALAEEMLGAGVDRSLRPPLACYLDRGRGAAIRRARTRFSDGELNPLALVRLPRERMIGSGVASSLAHEIGHQAAALLDLLEPVRSALTRARLGPSWVLWASEILADFWAVACLGVSATVGLLAVVTLPTAFVFRLNDDDVHPTPYLRTILSAELGERLFPDPQWQRLKSTWRELYPLESAPPHSVATLRKRESEIGRVADTLAPLRFPSLGASLREHMGASARGPAELRRLFGADLKQASPLAAIATLGQARADGTLPAESEARMLDELLRRWALERSGLTRFTTTSQGENHGQQAV
jgi:hypothetical protein